MLTAQVAIIGGGLSGLYAAKLLEERGIQDYVLLEARETLGGRILSIPRGRDADDAGAEAAIGRFDLGATWLWPDLQPALGRLIDELGLATFEQHESGDMLVERSRMHMPSRVDGYRSAPASWRVAGGMEALIEALRDRLTADRLVCGCHVKRLMQLGDEGVEVQADDMLGRPVVYRVEQVLLAVPPRLAVHSIDFVPALPDALVQQWTSCATWMAPHAKYVAVYEKPFWREQGLSGEARSSVGPLTEIHDASAPDGHAALFGFLGVPAHVRSQVPEADLLNYCRAQLVRLFGNRAALHQVELLKDWASDPYTAVAADWDPALHQSTRLPSTALSGAWRNQLIGIASEWSPEFSGYVAGAVDAARRGVEVLTSPSHALDAMDNTLEKRK